MHGQQNIKIREKNSPKTRKFCFLPEKRASSMKKADLVDMFKKASRVYPIPTS